MVLVNKVSKILTVLSFPVSLSAINILGLSEPYLTLAFMNHSFIKGKCMKTIDSFETQVEKIELVKTNIMPESYKSVLVFIKEDNKWLMVKNKFRSWEFPGGHKEENETIFVTAKREAFEEAGVEIMNIVYVGYYRLASGHTTLIVTAEVEKFHDIPEDFETVERKFMTEFPASLSFNDDVYPWLVANFCS